MASRTPAPNRSQALTPALALLIAVAATYYLGARLGFVLRIPPATTSVIWPPNALLTAILMLTPRRRWWLCIAAALPAHVLVEVQAGFSFAFLSVLFVTNCLEAVLAAAAVRAWGDQPARFESLRQVLAFVAGAVLLAPLVTSFPDAAAVHAFRDEPFALVFVRRLLSNSLSQLVLVPSVVLTILHGPAWLRTAPRPERVQAALLALGLVVVGGLVFTGYQRDSPFLPGGPYTALPFLMPLLIFAAVRFGPGGASLSLLATALLAIGTALSGWTPLTALPAEGRVLALQVFLILVGVPLLVSSVLMKERREIADTLRERVAFGELLTRLSGAFVHVPSHEMLPTFEQWLERVGRFFGFDRLVLRQFSPDNGALIPVAYWRAAAASPPPGVVHGEGFSWSARLLLGQQPIVCSDPDLLPSEAANEARLMRELGVRSMLAMPLVVGERVVGCLAFVATERLQDFSEASVQKYRLIADVFASAFGRKLAEDALRASESMKSAVLASLKSEVAVLDREGRIIAVNEAWTRYGQQHAPSGEVVGVGASYLEACTRGAEGGNEDALEAGAGIRAVLSGLRPSFSQEYWSADSSARGSWFHMTVVPLDRAEGGAVVSHLNVSDRRFAEAEAQRSRQELAHYLRVSTIGELTTSLAHELNQPLAAILANAQTARRLLVGPPSPEKRREVLEILSDIIEEDRRAGEVIRGLRDLLRKGEARREDLDLNILVRGVVRLLGSDVTIRGATLRLELVEGGLVARGDRVQLQQVLMNLVVNALEALGDSEGERQVVIRTERAGGKAMVSVEDTGPGLDRPLERDVFKPFFTTKPQGMGMGLSIARSILEAHGGTISLGGPPRERGACFTFVLPLVEGAPPAGDRGGSQVASPA